MPPGEVLEDQFLVDVAVEVPDACLERVAR